MTYKKEAHALQTQLGQAMRCAWDSHQIDFFLSALTDCNLHYSTKEIRDWLSHLNQTKVFEVEEIPISKLRKWKSDPETGDLTHESGGFFAIRGLEVETNRGVLHEWSQPIIDQPEIGVLGLIAQKKNGILYFLMQAKAEPGNVNTFQLSPSVQATRSNFSRLHGGSKTQFLEFFFNHPHATVLVDQLQSEQGARFYRKRNRNMIVQIPEDYPLEVSEHFRWLTLGQITELIHSDNTVNMDSRSVLSCISINPPRRNSIEPVDVEAISLSLLHSPLVGKSLSPVGKALVLSSHANTLPLLSYDEILRKITEEKFNTVLKSRIIPLKQIRNWNSSAEKIRHESGQYFEVIGVRIRTNSREVQQWDQPIIRQVDPGLVGFVVKEIRGALHFLVQLKLECGNLDLLELASTVQCITGSYKTEDCPPFIQDVLGESLRTEVISNDFQSEEGGRFFRESNQNVVALANADFPEAMDSGQYVWMTLVQLKWFLKLNNFLNIEARSILSGLRLR